MKESKIEWTNDTWNPWHGCKKISPGCKNCYMYRDKKRWGQDGSVIKRASRQTFNAPKKMNGPLVFTCSWSDFFIEQADTWRDDAWKIIKETPHLTYQILTKRPELIKDRLPEDWENGYENVWLGVSVESDDYLYRINALEEIPCVLRFVSAEPLLGPLCCLEMYTPNIGWVISGGESGPDFREAKQEWFMDIANICRRNRIPYFHKQNGGNKKIDNAWGGKEIKVLQEIPQNR